jgi:integrase
VIREVIGEDRPAASITRQDCHTVRETLLRMPTNARQKFPGMTIKEAITAADKIRATRLSPGTVNSYLENLSSLLKWGVEEWELPRNPASGLSVADPVADKERRQPFTAADLSAIFAAPLYTGCQNDVGGYAVVGLNRPRRGRFWIPLLALFHGLRQGEACQLHVADVRDEDGVPCIHLTEENPNDMEDADRKRIKTAAGVRYVPVHPEAIQCGFLEFVDEMRKGGHTRLFPEIVRGRDGYFSPYSKWFGRFLNGVGVKRQRVSFHSFRHSYRDAARRALLPRDVVMAIGGWAGTDTDDNYGDALNALGPTVLAEHMANLNYPRLDLSHLYR